MAGQRVDPADVLPPGAAAGSWLVEKEIGRGGMGAVYAVCHRQIGKRAALKVMHHRLVTARSAERILLEARIVNQVAHPNIVDIFETGTLPDGRPFIVMERLDGVSLARRADEAKILPDEVIGILLQVCDALSAAHAAGVVHRDLKLDNVFLIDTPETRAHPHVKLLDWGIAKDIAHHVHLTVDGEMVGTPQYLAPEQARGGAVSAQTDVYSLGVMAYELLLEQLPFEAETAAEIMVMHLRSAPPRPSEGWPGIPRSLEELLLGMLAKQPDARPTMGTVVQTLETVRTELDQRRQTSASGAVVVVPERVPLTRRTSPVGLAPTQLDRKLHDRRRGYALGALALAACAAGLLARAHVVRTVSPSVPSIAIDAPSDLAPQRVLAVVPSLAVASVATDRPAAKDKSVAKPVAQPAEKPVARRLAQPVVKPVPKPAVEDLDAPFPD